MTTESNQNQKSSSVGTIGGIILFVIFLFVIIGVATIIVTNYQQTTTNSYLDRGCTPEASGALGSVSIWNCPVP